jgi:hypothetical protein
MLLHVSTYFSCTLEKMIPMFEWDKSKATGVKQWNMTHNGHHFNIAMQETPSCQAKWKLHLQSDTSPPINLSQESTCNAVPEKWQLTQQQ